jgi:hypothetical protein
MSTTIATQLGVFGHKPEVISEILAGEGPGSHEDQRAGWAQQCMYAPKQF